MKQVSAALVDYLETATQLVMADCYTITLRDGTVLRYTNFDQPVVLEGSSFLANAVRIDGLKYKIEIGLTVDEQDITLSASPIDLVDGVPFLVALRQGVFDGAYVMRERAFLQAGTQGAIGSVVLFHGRVSTIDKIGRLTAQLKVKSDLVLLDIDMPRNLWSLGCLHTLYDTGCGLTKSGYATTGTVGTGVSNTSVMSWAGADAAMAQGVILFTGGLNAGVSTTVKAINQGVALGMSYPLDHVPAAGDSFTVWKGCDKTRDTCTARFNNLAHFRGFPYVPPPESAY